MLKEVEKKPHYLGHRKRLKAKFLRSNSNLLEDYEILEMVLFASHPRSDVKPLAKELIQKFGSLSGVILADKNQLMEVDGVRESVIFTLKLHKCIAENITKEKFTGFNDNNETMLGSWASLLDYCRLKMGNLDIEEFRIFFLNRKNVLIADEVQQTGTINHVSVYPREVVKRALELHASAVILAHNHPSGDPSPSKGDIDMTREIKKALTSVDIKMHDHIIISRDGRHYSFASHNLL